MDPLQNIRIVSYNLYNNILSNEGTFFGKTIHIHDVANQAKCDIRNPLKAQNYIKENSEKENANNIEIFVMNETCAKTLGINISFSSLPVYTSFRNPISPTISIPKEEHVYYAITRDGVENDDAFIISLAHYFRSYGVPQSNVLIYTEDNYDKDQHGLINIYTRTLIKPHVNFNEFAAFPVINIITSPLTEEEKKEQEEKKIKRKERFSTPKPTITFSAPSAPHFIPINRKREENTTESNEEKLKKLKDKLMNKKKEKELRDKLLADQEKRKKAKQETKSETELEEGEIDESNENEENYSEEKTSDNKRKRDMKYKEKYLKYKVKYEQLLKKIDNIKI